LEFRVQESNVRVSNSGIRCYGFRFKVVDLGLGWGIGVLWVLV